MKVSLLYHTVRRLRPIQIWGRLLTHLPHGSVDTSAAPSLRTRTGDWRLPIERPRALFDNWRVSFLNEGGDISTPAQWNDSTKSKLWLYNLHYFDDLVVSSDEPRRALQRGLVAHWIAENPLGRGNGWEPYPLSLRLVNWIKWGLSGETLEPAWRESLAVQARWLSRHIEWHLLGNHLLANAKALLFVGLYFDGPEAERWLAKGLSIYESEIAEQILADGGHFELSPMYHAIILEDFLDVVNLARAFGYAERRVFAALPRTIHCMRAWLAAMTHPDGGPAFFNDCAFGIAPDRAALEAYASRLGLDPVEEPGEGLHHLATSGYVRVQKGEAVAILDVAPIGPDYLPGHAHADTLSFELSRGKKRVIVNGGTSTYGVSAQRHLERSTASHSTVEINGENSSEVWGGFRVARRARPLGIHIDCSGDCVKVSASHDGYRRLPERPIHRRSWIFEGKKLTVIDEIESFTPCQIAARFHLGPGVRATIDAGAKGGHMATEDHRDLSWTTDRPALIGESEWRKEFGVRRATQMLAVQSETRSLTTTFSWPDQDLRAPAGADKSFVEADS